MIKKMLILFSGLLLVNCSPEPSSSVDYWSPGHKNHIKITTSMYGGGYGGHEYVIRLLTDNANDGDKIFEGTSSRGLNIFWKDDYSMIVAVCGGNIKSVVSNSVLQNNVNSDDFDHVAFYTQAVTMAGIDYKGRSICK